MLTVRFFTVPAKTFYLAGVKKNGYLLCDQDFPDKGYQVSSNPLVVVMESHDNTLTDKLAVERKIRRTLQRQLRKKEDEIGVLHFHRSAWSLVCRLILQRLAFVTG